MECGQLFISNNMTVYKQIQFKLIPSLLLMLFAFGTNTIQAQYEQVSFYYNKIPVDYGRKAVAKFQSIDGLPLGSLATSVKSKAIGLKGRTITLKTGTILDKDLFQWHQEAKRGIKKPRTIKLIQYDRSGKPSKIWTLEGVIPIESSGFKMNRNGEGSATYLKYKLDRCYVKSFSVGG